MRNCQENIQGGPPLAFSLHSLLLSFLLSKPTGWWILYSGHFWSSGSTSLGDPQSQQPPPLAPPHGLPIMFLKVLWWRPEFSSILSIQTFISSHPFTPLFYFGALRSPPHLLWATLMPCNNLPYHSSQHKQDRTMVLNKFRIFFIDHLSKEEEN